MKLVFLGTGGAGAKLKPEGTLEENQRRCTSLLIDDNVVVDMALQSFDYATKLGARTDCVTDVFLSHMHRDHYMKEALLGYLSVARQKINVWCHENLVGALKLTEEELERVDLRPVSPMDAWETAGMKVTALPANHADGNALHYIFEKDGKRLFYGLDGAWLTTREWKHMLKNEIVFDAMILDSTFLSQEPVNFRGAFEHNNVLTLPLLVRALKEVGVAGEDTKLIGTHVGEKIYSEKSAETLRDMGLIPAYDGFTIEI